MAEALYALQRDLDMVTQDVHNLKSSYSILDYIAKVVHDCELEQLAQGAQMRRIEKRLDGIEERLNQTEKRLDGIEERLNQTEKRLDRIEKRLDQIEKTLALIVKHLGVKPE